MSLDKAGRRFLGQEWNPKNLQVARTDGNFLYDARGRKYIDLASGWCVGNRGWGDEELRARVLRPRPVDYAYPEYRYKPWVELAEKLASIAPGKLEVTYRATGGTEAVDIAMQLAMAYTGRRKFISLADAYHGNSIGTVSIGGSSGRLKPPLDDRAAERVEGMLKGGDVAAVIMEPVSISLGVLIPEQRFMSRLAALCRRHGTLLVMDEVACGFGRTGKIFASEHFDIQPDILCMAKAITAGYAPMGATITTQKIAKRVRGKVDFFSTYGWHPVSVDVAIANVGWMIRNKRRLLRDVNVMSDHFRVRLGAMKFKKLRIKGLAIGVETGDADYVDEIVQRCYDQRLIVTSSEEVLMMLPPLTIDRKTADRALDILERAT